MIDILHRNNVKVSGQGVIPMLFAHGFGCDQSMWRLMTPAFEQEYKIVLFDHVGFGQSDLKAFVPGKYNSLQAYADDMLEICEELDLREVIFVGHSVSAMIGVLAAIKEPDWFQKLILIGPSPRYINDENYVGGFNAEDIEGLIDFLDSNYLGWSSVMAPVIMANPERPELGQELTNSFCRTNPEIAKNFARLTFLSDNRSDLPKVHTPSLVLQCAEDVIAPATVGEYVHEQLPNSKLIFMKATGHCPNLSHPEETIAAIKNFL
ncbi:hydrolase [Adhaeribacter aerolatus]|uniref:Hydrolase n=1 Tax=Adhaeribacter aerolatus TaxID=670289 RepID=A0A512B4C3_9BACT|nr:alpha/beta hydrolase [Adhaeribacter aerolatus]GEO06826.1 hydrolase [Adhaeribacter aerolatus]